MPEQVLNRVNPIERNWQRPAKLTGLATHLARELGVSLQWLRSQGIYDSAHDRLAVEYRNRQGKPVGVIHYRPLGTSDTQKDRLPLEYRNSEGKTVGIIHFPDNSEAGAPCRIPHVEVSSFCPVYPFWKVPRVVAEPFAVFGLHRVTGPLLFLCRSEIECLILWHHGYEAISIRHCGRSLPAGTFEGNYDLYYLRPSEDKELDPDFASLQDRFNGLRIIPYDLPVQIRSWYELHRRWAPNDFRRIVENSFALAKQFGRAMPKKR